MYTYDTVSEAINELRNRGYSIDFNLTANAIINHKEKFNPEEFEIVETYRFEGDTDPGDEAVVYAIGSKSGLKGVLVSGYGASAVGPGAQFAKMLKMKKPE